MTYILGIKSKDVGAIISDTMVSFERGEPNFGALKTGLLYPGCCYGAAGDEAAFRKFVTWCKRLLDDVEDKPERFWIRFQRLVNSYDFESQRQFELLLLTRHSGTPDFYTLDSNTGKLKKGGDFNSLGSGKNILDQPMMKFFLEEHAAREHKLHKDRWPATYWPFYYCQELMAVSQGDRRDELNKCGVGGVFHYVCQNSEGEYVQEAALYLIVNIFKEKSKLTYTVYRVLFGKMALVVENAGTNERYICIDTAMLPTLEEFNQSQLIQLQEEILSDIHQQPHYRFAGVAFADAKYQAITFEWIRGDDAESLITADGKLHELVTISVEQAIALIDQKH
jgi:hypothetical protein